MSTLKIKGDYLKFFTYFIVIVLINIVGVTLFFRVDLTQNRLYSLSDASSKVVETLFEPLSIKIFFTKDLPAPHNSTERYLHDLMEEYAAASGKLFNYKFYDVTAKDAGLTESTDKNRQIAEDYGISPVQIRIIENDEIKFKNAYMGLVIIHGDMIEKLPALTSTNGLEYKLTTAIQKLNNKVSALLSLEEKIKIRMYLSSSLNDVAPLMGLDSLVLMPEKVGDVVAKLNSKWLDKIDFKYIDPSKQGNANELIEKYNIMTLKWPQLPRKKIKAGTGCAGIVMEYKDKIEEISLIKSVNFPIIGTQYQMTDPESLEDLFSEIMESMIGINQDIGYLADHGTCSIASQRMGMMQGQQRGTMNVFNQLISQRYSIKDVNIKEDGVPKGLNCLIIARPTEKFSDYELFQIDQALMRGTSLAIFPDSFNEVMPKQNMGYAMGPRYIPLDTGLAKLLEHYGVKVKQSYVLDKNCYKQILPGSRGGGDQKIYFAPMIKDADINNTPGFMKNIKGLVAMTISPLELDEKIIEKNGISAVKLFSSSADSWEMKGRINLNPMYISPPSSDDDMNSYPLAYMLSGEFSSYFAGKQIPEKDMAEKDLPKEETLPKEEILKDDLIDKDLVQDDTAKETMAKETAADLSQVSAENRFAKKGKSAKIFVMACSQMLQDNMLDSRGQTTNATFILNVIDHLNNRDDIAGMRSKNQTLNPLAETTPFARGFIKIFNIAALPLLVILFGFGIWLKRGSRKKQIKMMFIKG